jgi:hypothetical protein
VTPDEIRNIDVSQDSEEAQQAFALSMLQEMAAQLAEMNQRYQTHPIMARFDREMGNLEDLVATVSRNGSIIPFLYPDAPMGARRN